jgi:hypothetical protein
VLMDLNVGGLFVFGARRVDWVKRHRIGHGWMIPGYEFTFYACYAHVPFFFCDDALLGDCLRRFV